MAKKSKKAKKAEKKLIKKVAKKLIKEEKKEAKKEAKKERTPTLRCQAKASLRGAADCGQRGEAVGAVA